MLGHPVREPAGPVVAAHADERFLTRASREQRTALKRDLEPVVRIYNQL